MVFRDVEDNREEEREDPFRKIIEQDFKGKKVRFDSNDMPMEKCDQICTLFTIERGKLHNPAYKTVRHEGESLEDFQKRLDTLNQEKPEKTGDMTFRPEGESEEDWYKRIFDSFKVKSNIMFGLTIINRSQQIVYGEDAVQLTEEEYKSLPLRRMMKFVSELLQEAGVLYAPEFDPKRLTE